jgi:uncharacterized protein (TIGR02145 family)
MRNIMTRNGKILSRGGIILTPIASELDYVKIGDQRWMKKNLAIDDGEGGIYTRTVNYGQGDVNEYYYTWEAAVRVASRMHNYHLPTKAEFDTLAETIGGASTAGEKLKSTYGWNDDGDGTDDYGFTALPAGYYDGVLHDFGNYAHFWTYTETSSSYAYYIFLRSWYTDMFSNGITKSIFYSVRLIKDVD